MNQVPRAELRLKAGRERSVLKRHPWVFSGSVAEVTGAAQPGDVVDVLSHDGTWLARASYSPASQIRARIWTWKQEQPVDEALIAQRIEASIARRHGLVAGAEVDAFREVYAESDALPGLIVDRYGPYRVVQLLTVGIERWREAVVDILAERGDCGGIYERSDANVRELEGLQPSQGELWGHAPPDAWPIREYGLRYLVDVRRGQKTGFYLDQRESRLKLRHLLSGGDVLDCFAYSGGFTVNALAAGARSVLAIDSSSPALEMAKRNVALNNLPPEACTWLEGDVFQELRRLRDQAGAFDVVVLDPPSFAPTSAHVERAARGYKDVNLLALKLLRPGGLLFTFSCSGGVGVELFQKIVAGAAQDARVQCTVIDWLGQPTDHPVNLDFPEGRYLKGLVLRVEALH